MARSLHEHKQSKTTFVQGPRRSRSAGKSQQIKQQKPNKQQDDPQIPQPDLRFVKAKNSKPDTQKGPEPKQKHPPTRFAKGHSGLTTVSLSKTCENELSTTTFKQTRRPIRVHIYSSIDAPTLYISTRRQIMPLSASSQISLSRRPSLDRIVTIY